MPRKTKKKTRRGGSLRDWIKKAHGAIRSSNGYSRGLSHVYNKYGKSMVDSKFGRYAPIIQQGIDKGLEQLKQAGYGVRRSGMGVRRAGMGIRRAGMGVTRAGNGIRRSGMGNRLKY